MLGMFITDILKSHYIVMDELTASAAERILAVMSVFKYVIHREQMYKCVLCTQGNNSAVALVKYSSL